LRGAAKRSATRARELEQHVWILLSKGKTPTAIGQEIGIARESEHRIIRRLEHRYRESTLATADELKRRQERALSAMVEEALEAFERSKQPAQRVRRTTRKYGGMPLADDGNHVDPIERQVQSRAGDVRFLTAAIRALDDIRKIYGLGAPYENFVRTSQALFDDPGVVSAGQIRRTTEIAPRSNRARHIG
jgi:hypothetical protein